MSTGVGLFLWSLPFLGGLGLTLRLRANTPGGPLWTTLAGAGLALGVTLLAVLFVSNSFPANSGEPLFTPRGAVEFMAGVGFVLWVIGVGVGTALYAGGVAIRRRRSGAIPKEASDGSHG